MKNWSIGKSVMFLALAPSTLIMGVLITYFTYVRVAEMDRALERQAATIARQLGPASEFGLYSGDDANLHRLTDAAQHEPNVSSVTIRKAQGRIVARSTGQLETQGIGEASPLVHTVPIYESELRF